uniref:T-complex protein 1 subunit gamma n=1 Tax=Meloidogyne javanica TaxID=6303 RepID=A0A915MR08_MELJA
MVNPAGYDAKVQQLLEECKISTKLVNYIENFNYPYVNDVQLFYEQLLKIGQGTFGEVFKARCKRTGQFVALKKILMENEKEGFPITALREIKMLKLLRHPNITELIDVCTCKQKNARERFSFYLVFTFCEHDLAGLLSNQKIKFSLVEIKTMAKHILEGLNKIHKSNILHRDMKSANVLITAGGVLKLADFGLARLMIKQQDYRYTNRVVTLWYRPPELLLGSSSYGPSIDIWGAGCIISELWTRSPILQGNTEQEQLIRIAKLCGSINSQTWEGCEALPLYSKLKASGSEMHSALNNALPQNYPRRQAISLIDQMLSLPPERRPTAEEALDHNFFWEAPLSAENIKGLVDKLKGTNLFEYTSGCGAHANRKRPIAPAAPTHNSSGSSQGSQPMHQQPRKPLNAFQQQPKSQHLTFGQHHQQFSGAGGTQRIKGNNAVAGQAPIVRMQSSQQRQHQPLSKTISSFSQQQSSSQSFSQQAQQKLNTKMLRVGGTPLLVLSKSAEREQGSKVQSQNINAAKMVADVIRTSLGPKAMLKMLMDPMGGIVLTNDGNAILREITVKHPAAKTMIEIARTQDEATGDGTTSVIILAGEFLAHAQQFLEQGIHPTMIIQAVDLNNENELIVVIKSSLGTKMLAKYLDLSVNIALQAVRSITITSNGSSEIDIKRYCRIEKIPGGSIEDSQIVKGVVLNKDIVHPKMSRRIEKPRVILLDCPLEYKKGESQTALEIMRENDFSLVLEQEEEAIRRQCEDIIKLKPDLVFTEKGISDLAQHYLVRAGITALRRLKKTDNNRLARVTGARIVNDTIDLQESDIGTQADLFEITKIGDEYFTWVTSEKTTAVTIVLRGPSKDIINEVDRNIRDAVSCVRNVMLKPRIVPGAGALEMALSTALTEKSKSIQGIHNGPYKAIANALEIIPRTLVQNCGGSVIRQLTALRAKHAQDREKNWTWGINGQTGDLADMNQLGIWDPYVVRLQALKTSIETAIMLLRIDDIVSGTKKKDGSAGGAETAGAAGLGAE